MRKTHKNQSSLLEPYLEVEHARELEAISSVLDDLPQLNDLVLQDLGNEGGRGSDVGCGGMSAEQVLRSAVIKQMNQFSYRELAFHLADSRSYRTFCRIGVMEKTPHVMLAGDGAAEFARRQGFEEVTDPKTYYRLPVGVRRADISDIAHGTVGAVALDSSGGLAAATSTGGTFGKLHGRIGDTPLIGPGTWADENIAISCTGIGEHIIRAGGASSIAFRYKSGIALDEAVQEMLDEVKRLGGDAGVIAVTRDGKIAMPYNSEGMKRACGSASSSNRVATFAD